MVFFYTFTCGRVAFVTGAAYHNLHAVDAAAGWVTRLHAVARVTVIADQGVMHAGPRRGVAGVCGTSIAVVAVHRVMLAAGCWDAGVGGAGVPVVAVRRRAALTA